MTGFMMEARVSGALVADVFEMQILYSLIPRVSIALATGDAMVS